MTVAYLQGLEPQPSSNDFLHQMVHAYQSRRLLTVLD